MLKETATQRDFGNAFRYNDICDLLRRHSVSIDTDLKQLLRLMLFNRAINNTDDHERNFSLINRDGRYQFAPAYDLVPSLTVGGYHAAGFDYQAYPPTPTDALGIGKIFGLSKTCVARISDQVSTALSRWPEFAETAGVNPVESEQISRCFC